MNFKSLLIFPLGLCCFTLTAQTQFWIENFGTATCAARGTLANGFNSGNGAWTQTNGANGAAANQWYVSPTEANMGVGVCSDGCLNNAALNNSTLHISAIGALCGTPDCGAAYNATGAANITDRRIESPVISCAGLSGISLNFHYIGNGQGVADNCIVWYFNGAVWATLVDPPASGLCGGFACTLLGICQGVWTNYTIALPASADNNPNVRIGFQWVNNGDGTGSDPSFAVDNVRLLYTTPLPVTLSSFSGICDDGKVSLNWMTTSEVNNDYFIVQRSNDMMNWVESGRVNGNGNSNSLREYQFLDEEGSGVGYYRLKQVDFNGESQIHYPISINCQSITNDIVIYPNPTNGKFTIEVGEGAKVESIVVSNVHGTEMIVHDEFKITGENDLEMDLSHLSPGLYFLRLKMGASTVIKHLVIVGH